MNNETLAALAEKKLEMVTGGLRDFRHTHLELFKKQGLKQDPEAYKFTNLKTFLDALESSPQSLDEVRLQDHIKGGFISFVFVDGKLIGTPEAVAGLKISTVEDIFSSLSDELKNENPFSHLHHSLLSAGIVVEVSAKTKIEKPIRIVNIANQSGLNSPTIVIKAGAFAEASIIEENYDQDIAHMCISETYVQVATGANIEHVQVSHGSATSLLHSSSKASVARDGKYRNVLLNLSGKLNRRNLNLELLESGAHGESYNLYLTNGTEHSDINTVIEHRAADTTSDQIAKGILDGGSKGIFTGKIHIHSQAQRVASGQLNKNLLLSKKSQAHSQPQLEIFADDVKCSHGSTTGQLSDDEVFYFQARGIPAEKAKTILAHGFGLEIVLKIQNKTIRSEIENLVMNQLKTKFHLGGDK